MQLGYTRRKKVPTEKPPPTGFFWSVIKFLASGFGSGYTPVAPGTAGTLVGALLFWYVFSAISINPFGKFLFLLVLYFVGVFIASCGEKAFCKGDCNLIVVDEIFGILVALSFFQPARFENAERVVMLAFVIYRLLDIIKPFPLKHVEKLPGGWGIMTDDALAGFITLLAVYLPFDWFWAGLLGVKAVVRKTTPGLV